MIVGLTLLCPWLCRRVPARPLRRLMWCLAAVYCAGNLYFTLLSRKAGTQAYLELIPFRSFARLFERQEETQAAVTGFAGWFLNGTQPLTGIILNVLLYYPLGYLLPILFPRLKPRQVLLIGLLSSVATELTQYLFKMGWCETDDVLHNTLGAALGLWVWRRQTARRPQK